MNSINWPASTGWNPVEAPKNLFFGLFRNCLNCDSLRCPHRYFQTSSVSQLYFRVRKKNYYCVLSNTLHGLHLLFYIQVICGYIYYTYREFKYVFIHDKICAHVKYKIGLLLFLSTYCTIFQQRPSPPRATAGQLHTLPVPGVWALAYPRATPGLLTHTVPNMEDFIGKDQ